MNWNRVKAQVRNALQRFAYGRAGADQLSVFLLFFSFLLSLFAAVLRLRWLAFFYYAAFIIALYRMLSKDVGRRYRENRLFIEKTRGARSWFRIQRRILQERKTHKHFKCPDCKQRLRVPKAKGNIKVRCSRCGHQFSIKS